MSRFRRDVRPVIILAAFFLIQWALLMIILTPVWDAAMYYAYARSTVFDGDLMLENDLLLSYPTAGEPFVSKQAHTRLTATGRVFSPYPIGSAILMLPVLAIMRLILVPLGGFTIGYEWPYLAVASAFSTLLGFLAFVITYRLAAASTDRKGALLAVVTLMFTTPLLYYQFREPLYSHTAAAFVTALLVFVWWRQVQASESAKLPGTAGALFLGGLLGLTVLVRWQQAIYAVLPLAAVWFYFRRLPVGNRRPGIRPALIYLLWVGVAGALVVSLQLAQWRLFNGEWLLVPQGEGFMEWQAPYLGEVLFSPFRGLLFWMPIFFPALLGLFLLARKRPELCGPLIIVLFMSLYINSSTQDWFGGGGYGPRKFTGEIIILGLGYAGFLAALHSRIRWWVGGILGLLLAWHQWILLRYGLVESMGGRVLSTYPFQAESGTIADFLRQFSTHLPDLFQRPGDFLVLPGAPIDLLVRQGVLPTRHAAGLLLMVILLLGFWWVGRRFRIARFWLAIGLVVIVLGNVWLLLWA
jgi:hypothetical protein